MLMALSIVAKGHSGISIESLCQILDAFNKDCLSTIQGDSWCIRILHIVPALGLIGVGDMWCRDGRANW